MMSYVRNVKSVESLTLFWREPARKNTLNLTKSGFVNELGYSVCKPKNIAIRSLNFLTSHIDFLFIFGQCGDNCK